MNDAIKKQYGNFFKSAVLLNNDFRFYIKKKRWSPGKL